MLSRNKRGQTNSIAKIVGVIFGVFLLALVILTIVNGTQTGNWGEAIETAFSEVSNFSGKIIYPMLGFLLNLDNAGNNAFLMVLTFILISIIIVGTLDSVNIFGDEKQGGLINLAIGIIVSIIGVRFMPTDIWASLTAPSSAFVATILVGAPFVALFFVTMKIKFNLASKLLWLFYMIFMSYLIFFPAQTGGRSTDFMWIYVIFLILAGVMMFFDASVRRIIYKEKEKMQYTDLVGQLDIQKRHEIRERIKQWNEILNDANASNRDKGTAKGELRKLRKQYGQDLSAI